MIRIKLLDGEVVKTERHTYEQAIAAKEAGVGIRVGGDADATVEDDVNACEAESAGLPVPELPERTIYPDWIASIEEVGA